MPEHKKTIQPSISNPTDSQDAAWAVLHTPLDAAELKLFCRDIERLFRINPMLNFSLWRKMDTNQYYCTGHNISQQPPFQFALTFTVKQLPNGIQIDYQQDLKSRTTFMIESLPNSHNATDPYQTKLTITDYYDGLPEQERKQHLHLVDKSITAWANDLQRYLIHWKTWSRYRLWRWYMRQIWQPMKPMGRRIAYILLWLTAFELVLILLGTAVYFIEKLA